MTSDGNTSPAWAEQLDPSLIIRYSDLMSKGTAMIEVDTGDRGVQTRVRGRYAREGGVTRVKGVSPRARGAAKHKRGTRAQIETMLRKDTSEGVVARGLSIYNRGLVHETDRPWMFNVGSENAGLFGYRVDLSEGACECEGGKHNRVCKHVVAAGVAFFARGES